MLSATADGPPAELLRVLGSRALEITPLRDVFDAMTELALHERRVARCESDEVLLLIVVEPDQTPLATELARAAALHAPHAGLWQYRSAATPQLSALVAAKAGPTIEIKSGVGNWDKTQKTRRPGVWAPEPQEPTLRLAGAGALDIPAPKAPIDALEANETEEAPDDSAALTADELAMLLSDDWELNNSGADEAQPNEPQGTAERSEAERPE